MHAGKDGTSGGNVKSKSKSESERPAFRWLVIGPQKSGASWHQDPMGTSAWNALLRGKKRWAMYPPTHEPPGHDESDDDASSLQWYFSVYPQLAPQERPLEFIQEPGDVIFIPSGWWHMVLNLETTVSVTQNFVDSWNLGNVNSELERGDPNLQGYFLHRLRTLKPPTFGPNPSADTSHYSRYCHHINRLARDFCVPQWSGFSTMKDFIESFTSVDSWFDDLDTICFRHNLSRPRPPHHASSEGCVSKAVVCALRPTGSTLFYNTDSSTVQTPV